MKPSLLIVALLTASSLLFACSGGSTGTTGDPSDKQTTEKTPTNKTPADKQPADKQPTEQTCQSSSLNGRCTAGPKKGASCCYAPSEPGDPPCSSSNDCDNLCRYCE